MHGWAHTDERCVQPLEQVCLGMFISFKKIIKFNLIKLYSTLSFLDYSLKAHSILKISIMETKNYAFRLDFIIMIHP